MADPKHRADEYFMMPSLAKVRSTLKACSRRVGAMGRPKPRMKFRAAPRTTFITTGAQPVRMRLASSPKTRSNTQNARFSMSQRPRTALSSCSGVSTPGGTLVMAQVTVTVSVPSRIVRRCSRRN